MKKALLLLAFSFVGVQQPKTYQVSLSGEEWNVVVSAIDNASLPGEVRKPLIQRITQQLSKQANAEKAIQDSIKAKIPGAKTKK